jgi:hypothetical protein
MESKADWTSLEVVKLIVSALTPIIIAGLGIWIARITKRFEHHQWISQKIIERRIQVYDEVAPLLNDLVVYFTYVGHWKELTPPQIIEAKRKLDRCVHISAAFFSEQFLSDYFSFINLCFKVFQGKGTNASLRIDVKHHRERAGASWKPEWDDLFCKEESDLVKPKLVRSAYQKLMKTLAIELQPGLPLNEVPSGRLPWEVGQENKMLQSSEENQESKTNSNKLS